MNMKDGEIELKILSGQLGVDLEKAPLAEVARELSCRKRLIVNFMLYGMQICLCNDARTSFAIEALLDGARSAMEKEAGE